VYGGICAVLNVCLPFVKNVRSGTSTLKRFGKALANFPEVLEAYLTTGEYDYFVKVAIAGTEGYERSLRDRLYKIPGIRHTRSCFVLRCLKRKLSVSP
jgi:Lrp/AsnC family transcriptional regulator, leucine-responsive regulatory protein